VRLTEHLCFESAGRVYALPVEAVRAVRRLPALLPGDPGDAGCCALDGEVVRVVDPGPRADGGEHLILLATRPTVGLRAAGLRAPRTLPADARGVVADGEDALHVVDVRRFGRVEAVAPAPAAASDDEVLAFGLADERFGLPIATVVAVLRPGRLHAVPGAPAAIAGTLVHRGEALVVLDPRVALGLPRTAPGPEAAVLVVADGAALAGLYVDRVFGLVALPGAPARLAEGPVVRTSVHGDDLVSLVDLDALLSHPTLTCGTPDAAT
jgi:chemotaxis signal transduction protein